MRRTLAVLVALLGLPALVAAAPVSAPTQWGKSFNKELTSDAGSAVSKTIAGVADTQVRIYGITARCSAGSAQLTVTDGGTQVWSSDASFVGTTTRAVAWTPTPYTGGWGAALVVTLGSCGGTGVGTLDVQADQY